MSSGTLYTFEGNFRAQKALVAAQYSGVQLRVPQDFVFGETNKSSQFLAKFPAGKVPAFESADGKVLLTESNAIAYYVSNEALRGTSPLATAQVLQWLSWADSEILPCSCAWVFPLLGIMPFNDKTVSRAKKDAATALTYLNNHLLTRTFLVGERITLADISVFCTLIQLYQNVLEPSVRKPYANVNRWFVTILNQPQVKAVLKDSVTLCETAIKFNPKKQAQAPKEEAKKPQAQQAAAPAKVEEDEAEEPEPTGFVMDNFKRVYSNEDESKSIPWFFEKFDPKEYSVWYGEYKYNEELTKVFMSCNLITGMFQRLDKLRKIAFASCILFGEDNNSSISGVWVWKGQDLIFPTSPDWQIDYESYEWTKLDYDKPETKKMITEYFSWTGTDKKGRKFNQGKIFK